MSVTKVAQDLAKQFTALGVRAGIDPQVLQPPFVCIVPNGFSFDRLGNCATFRFNLYAVGPGVRLADSLPVMDRLIDAVLVVTDGFFDANTGSLPFGDGELPAYVIPHEVTTTWEAMK